MLKNAYIAVAAILGVSVLSAVAAVPEGYIPFHTKHLVAAKGVELYQPAAEPYTQGGVILAAVDAGAPVELSLKNIGKVFPKISNAQEALELCQILTWGTLVESEEAFGKVVAAYKKQGFEAPKVGETERDQHQCWQYNGKMTFDTVAADAGEGFSVTFTAFVLNRGMGAPASVDRLEYCVAQDGAMKLKEKVRCLQGPYLNWQTEGRLDAAGEKKNEQEYAKRAQLIKTVYDLCPNLIPQGRKPLK
jgi:hypothetical protein